MTERYGEEVRAQVLPLPVLTLHSTQMPPTVPAPINVVHSCCFCRAMPTLGTANSKTCPGWAHTQARWWRTDGWGPCGGPWRLQVANNQPPPPSHCLGFEPPAPTLLLLLQIMKCSPYPAFFSKARILMYLSLSSGDQGSGTALRLSEEGAPQF